MFVLDTSPIYDKTTDGAEFSSALVTNSSPEIVKRQKGKFQILVMKPASKPPKPFQNSLEVINDDEVVPTNININNNNSE